VLARAPLVVDGNAVITRCVMASAPSDSITGGRFTGGIYGSLSMLSDFVEMTRADYVVVFFDGEVPRWRKELIPEYKDRRDMEERLPGYFDEAFKQIQSCWEIFPHLGMKCLTYAELEADDAVAAAVRVFADAGVTPVVATSDADMFQCCAMGGRVWDFATKRWVDATCFEREVGVPMNVYVLYRALVGDQSDRLKGARGCGPKRASALLQETTYGDGVSPQEQLQRLVARLKVRPGKVPAFVTNIVEEVEYLERTLRVIDLSDSFGDTRGLARSLSERVPLRERDFLLACRKAGLRSVLGDPENFLRPFRNVRARLDAVKV
jgi:5'-3' exonuclease